MELTSVVLPTQRELWVVLGERRENNGFQRKVVREGKRVWKVVNGGPKKEASGDP